MNTQEQTQMAVDIATSSPATVVGVTAGVGTIVAGLPLFIQVVTAFVLTCQAVAWIYKGQKLVRQVYNKHKNK